MNPPHDATHVHCGFCHQAVESTVPRVVRVQPVSLRRELPDPGTVLLATCPHCGAVWGLWPRSAQGETP